MTLLPLSDSGSLSGMQLVLPKADFVTMSEFLGKLLALLKMSVFRDQKRYTSSIPLDPIQDSKVEPTFT